MDIKELQKLKLTLRKTDPFRSQVYGNILDGAGKIAKGENRDVNPKTDIISSCKKITKDLSSTIKLVKEGDIVDAYKREIDILKEFLPPQVADAEVVTYIEEVISELENKNMKDMGKVISKVKNRYKDAVDLSFASRIIKEKLK